MRLICIIPLQLLDTVANFYYTIEYQLFAELTVAC